MANLTKLDTVSPRFNDNIFNKDYDITIASGFGNVLVSENDFSFNELKSIQLLSTNGSVTIINLNGFDTVCEYSGEHSIQFQVFKTVALSEYQVKLIITKNGSFFQEYGIDVGDSDGFTFGRWWGVCQSFYCSAGDIVNFQLEVASGAIGTLMYLAGFKFEVLDKDFYLPSIYTYPKNYIFNPDFVTSEISKIQGFGVYQDSLITVPTILVDTTYTQINIDGLGASSVSDYLPKDIRGISELWALNKITPIAIGDDYDGRLDLSFTLKTGTPKYLEVIIDFSDSTAGTLVAYTGFIQLDGTPPYKQSLALDYYTLETFKTNGGRVFARTDSGTITIGARSIKISRKSKYFA